MSSGSLKGGQTIGEVGFNSQVSRIQSLKNDKNNVWKENRNRSISPPKLNDTRRVQKEAENLENPYDYQYLRNLGRDKNFKDFPKHSSIASLSNKSNTKIEKVP